MPLMPSLVGGITVRERKQRYEGEPRYRRLDFVRSKKDEDDEWDIIRTSEPIRAVQGYVRPINAQWGQPYRDRRHPYYTHQPQQQLGHHQGHQNQRHPDPALRQIPAPPLSTGYRPHAGWFPQRQIEPQARHLDIVNLGAAHGSDSDSDSGNEIVAIMKGSRKKRGTSKLKQSGHSIFSDSGDDGHDNNRKRDQSRGRGRSTSRYRHDSDDDYRGFSRKRSAHRGWDR